MGTRAAAVSASPASSAWGSVCCTRCRYCACHPASYYENGCYDSDSSRWYLGWVRVHQSDIQRQGSESLGHPELQRLRRARADEKRQDRDPRGARTHLPGSSCRSTALRRQERSHEQSECCSGAILTAHKKDVSKASNVQAAPSHADTAASPSRRARQRPQRKAAPQSERATIRTPL